MILTSLSQRHGISMALRISVYLLGEYQVSDMAHGPFVVVTHNGCMQQCFE